MTDMLPELIAGRYEMRRRLGSSSAARVVLAHDVQLDRPVALKVLSPELSRDASAVDRFRAAAMSAGTIQDDAVVRAYDVVEHGGRAILVMEYVDGSNLSDAILTNRRFPATEAARIGAGIARGLDAVHRAGLVHGGLTPRDVLLSSAGSVKITDVGLAQVGLAGLDPVARATYAAPEQLQGRQGDARSDLYALGVILQELVTGRPPFGGTDLMSLTDQKLSEDPPLPSVTDPSVPPVYDAVVGSLLARDPALRPASAAAVANDLGRLEATLTVPAAAIAPTQTAMPAAVAATTVMPTTPAAPPPTKRRGMGWIIAAIVVLALAVGGLVAYAVNKNDNTAKEQVVVPAVVGQKAGQAQSIIEAAGLSATTVSEPSDGFAEGIVFSQAPVANQKAAKGSVVVLKVSSGPATTTTSSSSTTSTTVPATTTTTVPATTTTTVPATTTTT